MRVLATLEPDLVVMSNADYTTRLLDLDSDGLLEREPAISAWARAAADFASTLQAQQTPLVVIANNPTMPEDPIDCLARHRDAARCAAPSAPLLAELEKVRGPEQQALESVGVAGVLDPTPLICDEDLCQVIDDSGPIFGDANHLATEFVLTFVDPLVELFEQVL